MSFVPRAPARPLARPSPPPVPRTPVTVRPEPPRVEPVRFDLPDPDALGIVLREPVRLPPPDALGIAVE